MTRAPSPFELALVEALVTQEGESVERGTLFEAATFLAEQLDALPARLSFLFRGGMWLFSAYVWLRFRRRFSALDAPRRRAAVGAFAYGPVPLLRQLFRPVRSISLLAFYDR